MYFSRVPRKRQRIGAFNRNVVFALAAIGIVVVGVAFWRLRDKPESMPIDTSNDVASEQIESKSSVSQTPKDWVTMGGVARPATDVQLAAPAFAKSDSTPPLRPQGFSSPVASNANDQVAGLYSALKNRSDPAKFSSFVVPTSFDQNAFTKAPASYANEYAKTIEPGRVYATAQPADGVFPLRASSSRYHRVSQGESVRLSVESMPMSPVTFSSHGLGIFGNLLTSITVVANESGVATADFTASGGTVDEVQVLSGSPVSSGQVAFTISVKPNIK